MSKRREQIYKRLELRKKRGRFVHCLFGVSFIHRRLLKNLFLLVKKQEAKLLFSLPEYHHSQTLTVTLETKKNQIPTFSFSLVLTQHFRISEWFGSRLSSAFWGLKFIDRIPVYNIDGCVILDFLVLHAKNNLNTRFLESQLKK